MIEICAVGGYSEVGKNMTAIKIDDEVVILDMGICLPKIINFEELGGDRQEITSSRMIKIGAIPNDKKIEKWKSKVKVIALSHCHLDHLAAIPYLGNNYKAPIVGTPYTIEVLKQTLYDEHKQIRNTFKVVNPNSTYKVSENITLEFINITHSTLQTSIIAIHCKYGVILYANDFKFDKSPLMGKKANIDRLKELGKDNVLCLISECLYADADGKTPSEKVAREMLRDVMLDTESADNLMIITLFASHIVRLSSIIEFGKRLNRKIVFLGRSLGKYTKAAEKIGLAKFSKDVEVCTYARDIKAKLKQVEKQGRNDYLLVVTGNQGEKESVLVKMTKGILPFKFLPEDHVIFSSKTIPDPKNVKQREELEGLLRKFRVRIFKDIHVSGHARREDLRDLINVVNPKHIIPTHDGHAKQLKFAELTKEMGFKTGKEVHLMEDGDRIVIE